MRKLKSLLGKIRRIRGENKRTCGPCAATITGIRYNITSNSYRGFTPKLEERFKTNTTILK